MMLPLQGIITPPPPPTNATQHMEPSSLEQDQPHSCPSHHVGVRSVSSSGIVVNYWQYIQPITSYNYCSAELTFHQWRVGIILISSNAGNKHSRAPS